MVSASGCREISLSRLFFGAVWPVAAARQPPPGTLARSCGLSVGALSWNRNHLMPRFDWLRIDCRDMANPLVVTLDVGSSSVRTLLFDGSARQLPGLGVQLPYRITTTADGGVEVDGEELLGLAIEALSNLHDHMQGAGLRPAAVCCSAFWHSFLGIGADGRPTTPIIHLFDTRSAATGGRAEEAARSGGHARANGLRPAHELLASQTDVAGRRAEGANSPRPNGGSRSVSTCTNESVGARRSRVPWRRARGSGTRTRTTMTAKRSPCFR